MVEIINLKPQKMWSYFYDLIMIPRPSGKEEKVINYLKNFAFERKLSVDITKGNNVIIKKNATAGHEDKHTTILQSHMDVMCMKDTGIKHDFEKDSIKAYVKNGWIGAKGTNLGADNGIGIALILALLDDDSIKHGPLKAIFTSQESSGFHGVKTLRKDEVLGDYLINIDNHCDKEIVIGCAGAKNLDADIEFEKEEYNGDGLKIELYDSKGGHSGSEIHLDSLNVIKETFNLVYQLQTSYDIGIGSIEGGHAINIIPNSCSLEIAIRNSWQPQIVSFLNNYYSELKKEYKNTDPNIKMKISKIKIEKIIKKSKSQKIISVFNGIFNGVYRTNREDDTIESSSNIGLISTNDNKINLKVFMRSVSKFALQRLYTKAESLLLLIDGVQIKNNIDVAPWLQKEENDLVKIVQDVYYACNQKDIELKTVHEGRECGSIYFKNPNLKAISLGPNIVGANSIHEMLEVESASKYYGFVTKILDQIYND